MVKKHYSPLPKKHSSLLQKFVNYGGKRFITLAPVLILFPELQHFEKMKKKRQTARLSVRMMKMASEIFCHTVVIHFLRCNVTLQFAVIQALPLEGKKTQVTDTAETVFLKQEDPTQERSAVKVLRSGKLWPYPQNVRIASKALPGTSALSNFSHQS